MSSRAIGTWPRCEAMCSAVTPCPRVRPPNVVLRLMVAPWSISHSAVSIRLQTAAHINGVPRKGLRPGARRLEPLAAAPPCVRYCTPTPEPRLKTLANRRRAANPESRYGDVVQCPAKMPVSQWGSSSWFPARRARNSSSACFSVVPDSRRLLRMPGPQQAKEVHRRSIRFRIQRGAALSADRTVLRASQIGLPPRTRRLTLPLIRN